MEEITVGLLEARGLLAADSNGFSDPFAVLTLVDSKGNAIPAAGTFKTKVLKKTLAPQWNERFVVGDKYDLRGATALRVVLYDSDGLFASDDVLGAVEIPVINFLGGKLATPVRPKCFFACLFVFPRFDSFFFLACIDVVRRLVPHSKVWLDEEGRNR